mgnify:CR=1 FL=1
MPLAKSGEFDFTWNGAIRDTGNWAILKGSPKTANAVKFLDFFVQNPAEHLPFSMAVSFDSNNKEAATQVPADERRYRPGPPDLRVNGVETLPVRGKVHLLATGRASNVVAQVGDNGVLLVDAGSADTAADILTGIRRLSTGPVRAIVSTTTDLDHIGGNERIAKTSNRLTAITAMALPPTLLAGVYGMNLEGIP